MINRIKRLGVSAMLLVGLSVLFMPSPASARVRIGVTLGAPVYTYPVAPDYPYTYATPVPRPYYADPYDAYSYPPAYTYVPRTYVAPYNLYSWRGSDHDRHERREHERREYRNQTRERDDHGRRR
jgi:hypothetical protein